MQPIRPRLQGRVGWRGIYLREGVCGMKADRLKNGAALTAENLIAQMEAELLS
jgi:hypothetical protein